jgi:hypothetical protein
VVRLVPSRSVSGWEPARWSTAAHRALEDETLALLDGLQARPGSPIPAATLAAGGLGVDQQHAVGVLCGEGGALRAVLAPAGYGKTAMIHAGAHAAVVDGRPVVAWPRRPRRWSELADAGLPATTVARFRVDHHEAPLRPGTVVVLDEVSQSSTRELHIVVGAVGACPGGQLWVLGDPRQAPSVKAGGIAAELEARIEAGDIPAATLAVNRRQVDPVDRHALVLLRGGDSASSQGLRGGQGWEHEGDTPGATRSGMAEAVATDLLDHGAAPPSRWWSPMSRPKTSPIAFATASLRPASSPGRRSPDRLDDRPRVSGRRPDPVPHPLRRPPSSVVNGTVATITGVGRHGLDVRTDDGTAMSISVQFVRGVRADGTPNLSHAWVRTVDGAQGGTWDHAHLLGSAALDAYRGYTGQSRSRHPTHTWNTAAVDDGDHGGRLADQRTGQQQVAAALARVPDTTMAAVDDPWPTDRRLRAIIDAHHTVLDHQPPDRTRELADARHDVAAAQAQLARR